MKSMQRLTLLGLAGLILLSTTGCEGFITLKEQPSASASAMPASPSFSPQPDNEKVDAKTRAEQQDVAQTLDAFFAIAGEDTTYATLLLIDAQMKGLQPSTGGDPTAEQIRLFNTIPGTDYFVPAKTYQDSSANAKYILTTALNIKNLKTEHHASQVGDSIVSITIEPEKVSIKGDTAVVSRPSVKVNGQTQENTSIAMPITLKKQSNGDWKIQPNIATSNMRWEINPNK